MEIAYKNLDRFEELAQVLFWQAVEECYPENNILKQRPWINAWRIRLDPKKWSEEGLFEPTTAQRPLESRRDNFTGIFVSKPAMWARRFLIKDYPRGQIGLCHVQHSVAARIKL